jgi:hypothetical protein
MYKLTDHIWLFPGSLETDRPVLALITGVRRSLFIDTGNSSKLATDLYTSLVAYDADSVDPIFKSVARLARRSGQRNHTVVPVPE